MMDQSATRGLAQAAQRAKALLSEIRQGRTLLRLGQRILTDRRFQLGELLLQVRKDFSRSGTGAAGWSAFLEEVGLRRSSARRYLRVADHVRAHPELADRRSFQELYQELGLASPPPSERLEAAGPAPIVFPTPTFASAAEPNVAASPTLPSDGREDEKVRYGRPPLSEEERRDDIYMVRCNTEETLRLRRLSGTLAMRDAEVFREGILALEEREANKAAPLLRSAPQEVPSHRTLVRKTG